MAYSCQCRECGRNVIRTYIAKELNLEELNELLKQLAWQDVEQITPLSRDGLGQQRYLVIFEDELINQPPLEIQQLNLGGSQ